MPIFTLPYPVCRFNRKGLASLLVLLGLLTGCATPTAVDDSGPKPGQWDAQKASLAALDTWKLAGKVGLRSPDENTSATLDWHQYPHYFRLLVSGPFGGGRTVLEGREGRFSLTNSNGRFEAESPRALMEEQLGWSLPVNAMPYWVRGLPDAERRHQIDPDKHGFPNQIEQDGWTIDYRDWVRADDLWLPRRLVMSYNNVTITLVVNQWQPDNQ